MSEEPFLVRDPELTQGHPLLVDVLDVLVSVRGRTRFAACTVLDEQNAELILVRN